MLSCFFVTENFTASRHFWLYTDCPKRNHTNLAEFRKFFVVINLEFRDCMVLKIQKEFQTLKLVVMLPVCMCMSDLCNFVFEFYNSQIKFRIFLRSYVTSSRIFLKLNSLHYQNEIWFFVLTFRNSEMFFQSGEDHLARADSDTAHHFFQ